MYHVICTGLLHCAKSNMANEHTVFSMLLSNLITCLELNLALFNRLNTEILPARVPGGCALCSTYVTTCILIVFERFIVPIVKNASKRECRIDGCAFDDNVNVLF